LRKVEKPLLFGGGLLRLCNFGLCPLCSDLLATLLLLGRHPRDTINGRGDSLFLRLIRNGRRLTFPWVVTLISIYHR
jgi:hypothetical protein